MVQNMTHLSQDSLSDSQDDPGVDSTSGRLTSVELDHLLQSRQSSRRRFLQAGSITLVVALVAGFFVYHLWAGGFGHDSTSISRPPTDISIVLVSSVTYGSLSVNGKRLNSPPPAIASFHVGTNTVDLETPPFLPQHCEITWPEQQVIGATCAINLNTQPNPQPLTVRGHVVRPVFLVAILLTAAQLPQDARNSALHVVGEALAEVPTITAKQVPVGQYFAVGNIVGNVLESTYHLHQLNEPILAKAVTGSPLTPPPGGTPDCSNLGCTSSLQPEYASQLPHILSTDNLWQVGTAVSLRLDFSTAEGTSRGSLVLIPYRVLTLFLSYVPEVGWRVVTVDPASDRGFPTLSSQLDEYVCEVGGGWVQQLAKHTLPATTSISLENLSSSHGLRGCKLQLDIQQSNSTQFAQFVWRFGALLSVNATAHQFFPSLPMAPSDEIAAVTD